MFVTKLKFVSFFIEFYKKKKLLLLVNNKQTTKIRTATAVVAKGVNSVGTAVREGVNNDDTWRRGEEEERQTEKAHLVQRIIVAEKEHDKREGGVPGSVRRNGRVFRHMCFVSARKRDRRELAVCQRCTQRVQWFAVSVQRVKKKGGEKIFALTRVVERLNDIWINFSEGYSQSKCENEFWAIGSF